MTIECPIRFVKCGSKTIGLPPRLDTEQTRKLITDLDNAVYYGIAVTPQMATEIVELFNQADLINLF